MIPCVQFGIKSGNNGWSAGIPGAKCCALTTACVTLLLVATVLSDTALAAGVDLILEKGAEIDIMSSKIMDTVLGESLDARACVIGVHMLTSRNWLSGAASGEFVPVAMRVGNTDFQMSRGFTGISL